MDKKIEQVKQTLQRRSTYCKNCVTWDIQGGYCFAGNHDHCVLAKQIDALYSEETPEMVVCPRSACTRHTDCPELKPHKASSGCFGNEMCPDCIPVSPSPSLSDRPKIVCLCGSTRFTPLMMTTEWEYAKQGIIALGWFVRPTAEGEPDHHLAEKDGVEKIFDELHKRKIDLADEVVILNVGGYIGESTKGELEYARQHGKTIRFLEPES